MKKTTLFLFLLAAVSLSQTSHARISAGEMPQGAIDSGSHAGFINPWNPSPMYRPALDGVSCGLGYGGSESFCEGAFRCDCLGNDDDTYTYLCTPCEGTCVESYNARDGFRAFCDDL